MQSHWEEKLQHDLSKAVLTHCFSANKLTLDGNYSNPPDIATIKSMKSLPVFKVVQSQ